jgi:hypothetical protein
MPSFLDHHTMPDLPQSAVDGLKGRIERGETDEFGWTIKSIYVGRKGTAYCVSEAPNAEAVVKAHAAMGVPITPSDVEEVSSLT